MPETYEYSLGSVRAREKHLFTQADIESMLSLKDVASLAAYIRDKGFGEGSTVDEIIKSGRENTVKYLFSIVPDERIFDAFLLVNDVHNIKTVIKGLLSGSEYKSLFISPATVDFDTIETAVRENKFDLLPEGLSQSAAKAYEVLAHTADARLADAYLDRACMELQLKKAKESKIDFLYEYLSHEIFFRLIKTAIRACLTQSPSDYLETALCESYGDYNKKDFISLSSKGLDSLLSYLSGKNYYSCSAAVEAYKTSPAAFEKVSENILNSLARKKCKRSGFGAEPALGYFLARQTEEKAIHIIAVGIQTGADTSLTRERLRELYG